MIQDGRNSEGAPYRDGLPVQAPSPDGLGHSAGIPSAGVVHEVTDEGELTANWFCQTNKFWGTSDQLVRCARCGGIEFKRHDQPRHFRDIFKPTFHRLCDECYNQLPE